MLFYQRPLHNLIKLKKGIYVSEDDPNFLEKYLKYFPHDGEKIYQYAKQLKSKGRLEEAEYYYNKAIRFGYIGNNIFEEKIENQEVFQEAPKKEKKVMFFPFGMILLSLLMTVLFTIVGLYLLIPFIEEELWGNNKIDNPIRTIEVFENEEACPIPENVNTRNIIGVSEQQISKATMQPISLLKNGMLGSAVKGYAEKNGKNPENLEQLTQNSPNNYLSIIPSEIEQTPTLKTERFKLIFYEKNNQLAFLSGEQLLAVYPVASGVEPLPFTQSKVLARVVNPNGGNGPLGTRGLVLEDNYAIHGTNNPSLIGKNVSLGCLRMRNEDIEALYPYVPLQTPFFVERNKTINTEPLFPEGLPILPLTDTALIKESHPNSIFHWKS